MAFEEDLDVFFDLNGFAEEVSYKGSPIEIIFDDDYFEAQGMQGSQPVAICKPLDVAAARHGDILIRNGVTYEVAGVKPYSSGMTLLALEKQ